jgi:hypothetical protein
MPESYYSRLIGIIAIPDYTCNYQEVVNYHESLDPGDYLCFCSGSNYNGLPSFTFNYYDKRIEYTMTAGQYLFDPYLNYTTGLTKCVLALAGPTKLTSTISDNEHVVVLG